MKKSLMLISFAFIFLLSVSIVSAGLWITGDVQKGAQVTILPQEISKGGTEGTGTFSRTSEVSSARRGSTASADNNQERGPRGWAPVEKAGGGTCYTRKEGTTRGFGLFRR